MIKEIESIRTILTTIYRNGGRLDIEHDLDLHAALVSAIHEFNQLAIQTDRRLLIRLEDLTNEPP